MARRYDEPVDVRTDGTLPQAFVWHGQVYRVRAVVARWYVRSAWWRQPEQSSLAELTLEHPLWRVEAARGGQGPAGVFDLLEGTPWRLVRAWD